LTALIVSPPALASPMTLAPEPWAWSRKDEKSLAANGTGSAMVKRGGDTWFFLTADYAFGQSLQTETWASIANR
jgi:hypothetical protein